MKDKDILNLGKAKKQWKKPAIKNTVKISSITKGTFGPSVFDGSFTSQFLEAQVVINEFDFWFF